MGSEMCIRDRISSDHRPVAAEEKELEIDVAPFGIVGLETLLPLCVRALIDSEQMEWPDLIARLTIGPANVLGLDKGSLAVGSDADVVVIDPDAEWEIAPAKFRSRSANTPFGGWQVRGRIVSVFVAGKSVYPAGGSD